MTPCPECYSDRPRITPLLNLRPCLERHKQYVCGTCGRCICIAKDPARAAALAVPLQVGSRRPVVPARRRGQHGQAMRRLRGAKRIGPRFVQDIRLARRPRRLPCAQSDKSCPRLEPLIEHKTFRAAKHADIRMLGSEEVERYLEEKAAESA